MGGRLPKPRQRAGVEVHMKRLAVQRPCSEDYERMSIAGDARFCARCEKHVHDVRGEADERRVIRTARARGDAWMCIRVAVASTAMGCAPAETHTFEATVPPTPLVVASTSGTVGGICDIDPSACPQLGTIAPARYVSGEIYAVGSVSVPKSMWTRVGERVRRVFRRVGR